jgi:hypothetical protein
MGVFTQFMGVLTRKTAKIRLTRLTIYSVNYDVGGRFGFLDSAVRLLLFSNIG